MKNYQTFEEIEYNLKRLKLERSIAFEQMKLLKEDFKDHFKPANWIVTIANVAGKYGFFMLLKRLFK